MTNAVKVAKYRSTKNPSRGIYLCLNKSGQYFLPFKTASEVGLTEDQNCFSTVGEVDKLFKDNFTFDSDIDPTEFMKESNS